MRVALVLAGPYPELRGSQVLVRQLADGLRGRGHEVHPVTYGATGPVTPGLRPGRLARDAALAYRLWRTVHEFSVDVIHAHNYEAAIAALIVGRLVGTPVVYHGHNALAEELPTYFRRAGARRLAAAVGRLLDATVPRRADFCIAVSEELGEILRRRGVAEAGLACIPPAAAPVRRGKGPEGGPTGDLVCYAGNLDGYQNLDFLLRSFARVRARVPGARLVVATHAVWPSSSAAGAGVEIVRAGSYDEVRALLDAAAVAVSTRTERSGFPMKLLNYMAAGKAIVALAGGAKGLRDGVTARIVPDGDEDAFAAAVAELLVDSAERRRLGTAARRVVEDPVAWDTVLDRIEAIYRRVVVRGAAPAAVPVLAGR